MPTYDKPKLYCGYRAHLLLYPNFTVDIVPTYDKPKLYCGYHAHLLLYPNFSQRDRGSLNYRLFKGLSHEIADFDLSTLPYQIFDILALILDNILWNRDQPRFQIFHFLALIIDNILWNSDQPRFQIFHFLALIMDNILCLRHLSPCVPSPFSRLPVPSPLSPLETPQAVGGRGGGGVYG